MKKHFFITTICCICGPLLIGVAATKFTEPKTFIFTQQEAETLFQTLETSKKALPTSQGISALELSVTLRNIDTLQKVMIKQAQPPKTAPTAPNKK